MGTIAFTFVAAVPTNGILGQNVTLKEVLLKQYRWNNFFFFTFLDLFCS